jgi:hypothetical protein
MWRAFARRTNYNFTSTKTHGPRAVAPRHLAGNDENSAVRRTNRRLIDEVRISRSERYNLNFTPQSRLNTDAETLALYHFDDGAGDVLTDSSGNNRHGKIIDAKWDKVECSRAAAVIPAQIYGSRR